MHSNALLMDPHINYSMLAILSALQSGSEVEKYAACAGVMLHHFLCSYDLSLASICRLFYIFSN